MEEHAKYTLDAQGLKNSGYVSSEDEYDLVCTSYAPKQVPPRKVLMNPGTLAFGDAELEDGYREFHHEVLSELSDRKIQSLHVCVVAFYLYLHAVSLASFSARGALNVGVAALHALLLFALRRAAPAFFARRREQVHVALAFTYLWLHLNTHPVPTRPADGDPLALLYTMVLGSSSLINLGIFLVAPVMYRTQLALCAGFTAATMAHRNPQLCALCSGPSAAAVLDTCWAAVQQRMLPHPALSRLAAAGFAGACSCHGVTALLQLLLGVCLPSALAYRAELHRRTLFLAAKHMVPLASLRLAAPRWVKAAMLAALAGFWAAAAWALVTALVSRLVPGCELP
jgi:hypothetical protein